MINPAPSVVSSVDGNNPEDRSGFNIADKRVDCVVTLLVSTLWSTPGSAETAS